jgi:hypothetical protein
LRDVDIARNLRPQDLAALDTRYAQTVNQGWVKLNSGAVSVAASTVDIPLPAGYKIFDLLVDNCGPTINNAFPGIRISLDGTTFINTAGYTWGVNSMPTNAKVHSSMCSVPSLPINPLSPPQR